MEEQRWSDAVTAFDQVAPAKGQRSGTVPPGQSALPDGLAQGYENLDLTVGEGVAAHEFSMKQGVWICGLFL